MPRMTAKLSSVGISPAVIPWTDNVSLVSSENDDRSRRDAEVPGLRGGMEPWELWDSAIMSTGGHGCTPISVPSAQHTKETVCKMVTMKWKLSHGEFKFAVEGKKANQT